MKKQFDLKYYLEHPETKLVTRDERDARILCTDLKNSTYPIVAACDSKCNGMEIIVALTNEGKTCTNSIQENPTDLFFNLPDPVKKRVPLTYEDLMERIKAGKSMWVIRPKCAVLILGYHNTVIKCAINFDNDEVRLYTYSDLMEWGEFADGDKTWKEVEE